MLQSSQLVTKQSLALSHRDFSPVSQYEGLQVSVEYVTRDGDMTPHVTRDAEMTSHVTRDGSQRGEGCHHTHLQCYRSTRLGRGHNGDISRCADTSLHYCRACLVSSNDRRLYMLICQV